MNLTSEKKEPFGSLIQVHLITLDWFEANLKGKIELLEKERDYNEITLIPEAYGNKYFHSRAQVYIKGFHLGEVKFNPRTPEIIQQDTVMFKANNQLLYDKDFYEYFEVFFTELNLQFSHIKKLDIASDGTGFMKPLIMADKQEIEWLGKGDFQPFKKNKSIGLDYEGFWLGSKKSDKFARCYLKKDELAKSGKVYINHFWQVNNLFEKTGTDRIERLEFTLGNKEISKWLDRGDWQSTKSKLSDSNYLARLFYSVSKSLFQFRELRKTAKTNVSRLRKLFQLDFSLFGAVEYLDKIVNTGIKRIRALKTTCKAMFELSLKTGLEGYEKLSREIAVNINHVNWFKDGVIRWRDEFKRLRKQNLPYIPMFTNTLINERHSGRFYKDPKQLIIQDETQIDKIIHYWNQKEYSF